MTLDLIPALIAFCFVGVITPGPNNLMLMASGANFGFRRTVPHMFGVGLGMPVLVLLVGVGIIRVFELYPIVQTVLTALSVAYLLFLAWKIANAAPPPARDAAPELAGRPLTFLQAAAFQWVNPKAWFMALSAITLYAGGRDPVAILWVAGAYCMVSTVSTTSWTALGQQMRRFLSTPGRLRVFNWTMAALLVATLIPVLWPA